MKLMVSRWIPALATLATLACVAPAASANAKRPLRPMAVTAARNATAARSVPAARPAATPHAAFAHHRGHHRHLRGTTLAMRRAVGSTHAAHLPLPTKPSHRNAIPPTIAHRAPTYRTARGNPQHAWVLPGQGATICLAVRDLRASECLKPMFANDPVWSGRGPPRAGPYVDQIPPPRPAPTGFDVDAHPTASASNTDPRLTNKPVVTQAALRCLLACRPEGTAARSFMPSRGVEHVS